MTRICEATDIEMLDSLVKDYWETKYLIPIRTISIVSIIYGMCIAYANPDLAVIGIAVCGISLIVILAAQLEVVRSGFRQFALSSIICAAAQAVIWTIPDWTEFSVWASFAVLFGFGSLFVVCLIGDCVIREEANKRRNEIVNGVTA